ncbi:DMT family transporter [Myroides pelagicus]|uniref:EamA family transporter n=1 Tax=Myroides pelagicus TaxID=270914 RepID=A0A7K1GMC4_9FLAO|nr:DMT family transporter [Myroides pelagicus]MEC4113347.1 DMT family transporter [Myroides pelagicus]MTH29958.1 EamA family transporter [Myroides pelagicus]
MEQASIVNAKEKSSSGWLNGFIGVLLFAGSMPATKMAVSGLDPIFATAARAVIAAALSLLCIVAFREKLPTKEQVWPLIKVAIGGVIGFPLLTAMALQHITSAHSLVFMGMLPLSTAVFAVFIGKEKPKPIFWLFSLIGSALVIGFAFSQGVSANPVGDILMILAIILCGQSYAEGAKLSKTLGGYQVISWACVISLPLTIPIMLYTFPTNIEFITTEAWFGLFYISVVSMFLAYIFWYKGLAQGGIATVGQIQLLQPLFGMILAATVLNETISPEMLYITFGVILCVAASKRFAK